MDLDKHKLNFLQQKKVGCVYNSSVLCHDFHSKDYSRLYKSESPYKIYECTLLHTKNIGLGVDSDGQI